MFRIHIALFIYICYLYVTGNAATTYAKVIGLGLVAHLLYVTFFGGDIDESLASESLQGTDYSNGAQDQDLDQDLGNDLYDSLGQPDEDISTKWFSSSGEIGRVVGKFAPPNTEDFWNTITGGSLTSKSVPLCTRSFSSYNPHQQFD